MDAGTIEGAIVMRDLASAVVSRVEQALGKLEGRAGQTAAAVDKAGSRFDRMGDALGKAERTLKSVGTSLSLGVSLPLAGAAASAFKFGSDFEAAMTKVVTLSGNSADQMEDMRAKTLALGPAVGKGPQELADALLVVTSTGQKGAKAMEILTAAAKAGAVGLGDTKDIARAVTSAITAYGEETLNATKATEILFKAVKDGGAEASEFAGTLGRVVGIAAQVGVSFEEVTGFVATFSRLGVDAAEATTALRAVMTTFIQPTREAEQALKQYDLTIQDVRDTIKKKGLAEALLELQDRLKGNDQAMAAIFGNVRGLAGVLGVTGAQANTLRDILGHLKKQTDELGSAFALRKKDLDFRWDQMKAQVQQVSIAFGDALKPAFIAAFNAFQPLLDMALRALNTFSQLPDPVKAAGVAIFGIVAAAGPAAFMLGQLASGAQLALKGIQLLAGTEGVKALLARLPALIAALKELLALERAFGFQGLVVGLQGVATQAGLSAGFLARLVAPLKELGQMTRTFGFEGLVVGLRGMAAGIGDLIAKLPGVRTMIDLVKGLGTQFGTLITFTRSFGSAGFLTVLQDWGVAFLNLARSVPLVTTAFQLLTGPVGITVAVVTALLGAVRLLTGSWDFLTKPLGYVRDLFADLYVVIKDELIIAIQDLWEWAKGKLVDAWNAVAGAVQPVIDWFKVMYARALDLYDVLKDKVVEAVGALIVGMEQLYPGITQVAAAVAAITGKYSEWRQNLKETADHIRAKNAALAASTKAANENKGAVKGAADAAANLGKNAAAAAPPVVTLASQLAAAQKVIAGLSAEQRKALDAAIAMNKSGEDTIALFNKQFHAVKLTTEALELYKEAAKGSGEETKKLAKEAKELAEALSGKKAVQDAEKLIAALKDLPPIANLTAEAQQQVQDTVAASAQVYRALGQSAPDTIRAIYLETFKLLNLKNVNIDLAEQLKQIIPPPELKTQISAGYKDLLNMRVQLFQDMSVITASGLDAQIKQLEVNKERELQVWRDATKGIPGAFDEIVPLIDQKYKILLQHAEAEVPKIIGPFEQVFRGIPDLISSAFTGGGGFKGAGKALASQLGAALGGKLFSGPNGLGQKVASGLLGKVGGALAGKIGGLVGMIGGPIGSILGSLGGKLVGGLFGKLFGGDAKKTKQMREEFLKTAGGIDEVRKKAEYAGVSVDKLLKTKKSKEFTKEVEKLEKAFEETQKRVQGLLTDLGGVMEKGDIISRDLWKRLLKDKDKEEVKKALADVFTTSVNRALEGFNKISAGFLTLTTGFKDGSKDMQRLLDQIGKGGGKKKFAPEFLAGVEKTLAKIGPLAQAAFGAALGSGKTFQEALAAIKPGLTEIQKVLTATGQSAGGFLGQLLGWSKIVENNQALFDSLSGVNDMLVGLQNSGYLTQEAFTSLTGIISNAFTTLTGQGVSATDAIQSMQPQLQKAWELMHDFGFVTDETTAKILKQAEESGLVGDKFRSSTDRMIAAVETLVGKIDTFITKLGGGIADAAGQARSALDRIPDDIRINIRGRYIPPKNLPSGAEGYAMGGPVTPAPLYKVGGAVKKAMGYAKGTREPVEKPEYLAGGGATAVALVPKGSDTIPAMLTKGEWVIPADVVRALGTDFLKTLIKSKGANIPLKLVLSVVTAGAQQAAGKVAEWWKGSMAFVEKNPLQVGATISGEATNAVERLYAKLEDLPTQTPYTVTVDEKPIDDLRQRLLALPEAVTVNVDAPRVATVAKDIAALPREGFFTLTATAPALPALSKQIASLPVEKPFQVVAETDGFKAVTTKVKEIPAERTVAVKAQAEGLTEIAKTITEIPEDRLFAVTAKAEGLAAITKDVEAIPEERRLQVEAKEQGLTEIAEKVEAIPEERRMELEAKERGLTEITAKVQAIPTSKEMRLDAKEQGLTEIDRKVRAIPDQKQMLLVARERGLAAIMADIRSIPTTHVLTVEIRQRGLEELLRQIDAIPDEHPVAVPLTLYGLPEVLTGIAAIPRPVPVGVPLTLYGLFEVIAGINTIPKRYPVSVALPSPASIRAQANAIVDQILGALNRIPSEITIKIGTSGSQTPKVPQPPPVTVPPGTPSVPRNPMPPPTTSPLPLPPSPMPYPAPTPPPSTGGTIPGPPSTGGGIVFRPGGGSGGGFSGPSRTYGSPGLQFEQWGDGTLAMLHGREAVVPEGRAQEFADLHGNAGAGRGGVVIEKLADEIVVNVPEGTPDPSAFGRKVIRGMFAELRRGGGDLDTFRHFVRKVQK